ncbi:hypothetical protein CQ018_02750 [Arthrobacter sp. MYb227]|nr:hypothetical protein CQ018_02750 [Arthrobacter sp. MYb227]
MRNRQGFSTLMISLGFGAISSGILNVADDLVAIYALGASATQIGILNAAGSLTFLFFAIPAGMFLDRVNRIKVMIVAQCAAGLAIFSVPICWALGVLSYPQLVAVSFLGGIAGMLWSMGAGSTLPALVGKDLLSSAYARKETVETSIGIVAPGFAGLLIAVISAPFTLLVAAIANVLAALSLIFGLGKLSGPATEVSGASERLSFKQSFSEGWRFTLTKPLIRALIASSSVTNMGLAFGSALETIYFVKILGFSPQTIGLLISTVAVGGLLGSLVVPWLVGKLGEHKTLALSVLSLPLAVVLIPLAAMFPTAAVILVVGNAVLYNALMVSYNATAYGLLAGLTPNEMMGRQQGFRLVFTMGPVPLFGIIGGLTGDALGLQNATWIWVGITACAAVPLFSLLRSRRPVKTQS